MSLNPLLAIVWAFWVLFLILAIAGMVYSIVKKAPLGEIMVGLSIISVLIFVVFAYGYSWDQFGLKEFITALIAIIALFISWVSQYTNRVSAEIKEGKRQKKFDKLIEESQKEIKALKGIRKQIAAPEKKEKQRKANQLKAHLNDIKAKFSHIELKMHGEGLAIPMGKEIPLKLCKRPAGSKNKPTWVHSGQGKPVKYIFDELVAKRKKQIAVQEESSQESPPERFLCLILGQAGSGKSTLMKWIALQVAQKEYRELIPAYIPLHKLKVDHIKEGAGWTLPKLIDEYRGTNIFEEKAQDSKLVYLLDGLDEIADSKERDAVIDWINGQTLHNNILIITSRFSGLSIGVQKSFSPPMTSYEIPDLSYDDMKFFLEERSQKIQAAYLKQGDKELANKEKADLSKLLPILKDNENVRKLAVTPLLLIIISIVHSSHKLPEKRTELYKAALNVMLKGWIKAKGLSIKISVEKSMEKLAHIAYIFMIHEVKEMSIKKLENFLKSNPEKTEVLEGLLNEITLKSGVLYQREKKRNIIYDSEGNYGFIHLTFQEYLAASYLAGLPENKLQEEIAKHAHNSFWNETFKLLVGILPNPKPLFNHIILNLINNEYWKQMSLWEDCLQEVSEESIKHKIEIQFAEKVIHILQTETDEEIITQLFLHYPLYIHAKKFGERALNLFDNAPLPFVKSVGASILNKGLEDARTKLFKDLQKQIQDFADKPEKTEKDYITFTFRHNNSFLILITTRRINHFHFIISLLKIKDIYLVLLNILEMREILYIRMFRRRQGRGSIRFVREIIKIREILDLQYLQEIQKMLEILNMRDIRYKREIRFLLEMREAQYKEDISYSLKMRDIQQIRDIREIQAQLLQKQSQFQAHLPTIQKWADKALKTLQELAQSKPEVLKYFPHSTDEDIEYVRNATP